MSKKNKDCACDKKISMGGSALIEGIMMQGPHGAAMSVRLPDGGIDTEELHVKHLKDKFKPAGIPIIRGIVNMVESMLFSYKCMEKSALKAGLDDDTNPEDMSKLDKWLSDHFGPKMMAVVTGIAMVLGVLLAFGLFTYLPSFLVDIADEHLFKNVLRNIHPLFEGLMRMVIFVAYIWIVSKMPDIKRVFMYHGAEHKSIFCYEAGLELTVENVKKQKRFHPRCGTSFIFVILIISILVSSIVSVASRAMGFNVEENRLLWMGIKLLILPFTVGIGYEFIRYAGRHNNIFVRVLSAPGLFMQRITTAEPTDDIIEVGIEASKAVLYGIDSIKKTPFSNEVDTSVNTTTKSEGADS